MEAVDRIVRMIFIVVESRTLTVLIQELRLLETFSAERAKHDLGVWLWKIAEDVEGQVVAI